MEDSNLKKETEILNKTIVEMGAKAKEAITSSLNALLERDIKKAGDVIEKDKEIDTLELKIDEQCLKMLALYQPVASDLRFIAAGMTLATDLERIADLASEIALRVIEMDGIPLIKPLIDIPKMAEISREMVDKSLLSFINRDVALAKEIPKMKDETDRLRKSIYIELKGLMTENPQTVTGGMPLLLISYHLERIAGHAINIAEQVVYMVNAEVIKHKEVGS